ncbi:glycosyltransferase family 4 protein [Curtobacterium pusillum]|uniref:Glycosyltransferase n=1 Tax=Curtobacterium pusillum TaxID=69373 RepID=A0ABX2M8Y9_9MICO|nr:glycosyltransferase [Curtobacterium pusillum]NUU14326.1 glycosyltransferase [Curtobacterium pusillum]GLK32072.1 glycosyl transferase [Curtobacterium pusillum]
MHCKPRPFDIVHVSSAHPWTDNRVHLRAAATAAAFGYRTALVAVSTEDVSDGDWSDPDPVTGVYVRRLRRRRRIARMSVSTAEAIHGAISSRARVVHLHDPELLWALPLLALLGRKVVYDAHEDLPAQVLGKEYLRPVARSLFRLLAWGAVILAGRASVVVAATPDIARRFDPRRTTVVRNLPRIRIGDDTAADVGARAMRAVYLGAMSRDRGLEVLCAVAASRAQAPGWDLVTAGPIDGAVDRQRFDALVDRGAVDHRGVLDPGAARDLLLDCRVGLVPLLPTPAYSTSIPTKLFEYMAAGLAVIATDIPFWRRLLSGVECVTWVPPGDPEAITRALRSYASDPVLLDQHATAGRAAVRERFRWEYEQRRLVAVYRVLGLPDPAVFRNTTRM